MPAYTDEMSRFEFLIGNWDLDYRIPQSAFHKAATDKGNGTFKRALNDRYVFFDYATVSGAAAHGVFGWDEKCHLYRYQWFENSGAFSTASCKFINDHTLYMQWHDALFVQTFTKLDAGTIRLRMEHPDAEGKYELVLEVLFSKK